MRGKGAESDDRGVLNLAVLASLLAAVVVELRHRSYAVAVQGRPSDAKERRARFLFETWLLTGACLILLAATQPGLR
jgi:hypothetical protein